MAHTPERTEIVREVADPGALPRDALRVAAAGVNAWIVTLLVPCLTAGHLRSWVLGASTLALLAAGVAMLRRWRAPATWLLLGVFPIGLAATLAGMPTEGVALLQRTGPLALAGASLILFLAVAVDACERPGAARASAVRPLVDPEDAVPRNGRARRRGWLLAVTSVGALALAVVAPMGGSRQMLEDAWPGAADEAQVLTAVAAGLLGVALLSLIVAPATRRKRPRKIRTRHLGLRVLLIVLLGALGLYLRYRLG